MPFAYYHRLSRRQQKIYRRSDAIGSIEIPDAAALGGDVDAVRRCLEDEDASALRAACEDLCRGLTQRLQVPPLRVRVLPIRPSNSREELHGLYEPAEGSAARVTVWMRTAHHKRVVAFRTFLRTLLHEVCHHLDYELLGLEMSFHNEGFFRRESSLVRQLLERSGGAESDRSTR